MVVTVSLLGVPVSVADTSSPTLMPLAPLTAPPNRVEPLNAADTDWP